MIFYFSLLLTSLSAFAQSTIADSEWQRVLLSQRTSPVLTAAPEAVRVTNSVGGSILQLAPVKIVVQEPSGTPAKIWSVAPIGTASSEAQFRNILSSIRMWQAQPANAGKLSRIEVGPGTYYFNETTGVALDFSGLRNTVIAGLRSGSPAVSPKFIFSNPVSPSVKIDNSRLLKFQDIDLTYNLSRSIPNRGVYGKIAYVGEILPNNRVAVPGLSATATSSIESVRSFNPLEKLWYMDPVNGHTGISRAIHEITAPFIATGTSNGTPVYSNSQLGGFEVGEDVILLHTRRLYGCTVTINGRATEDITLQGLRISNYPQMAIRVDGGGRGFKFIGNTIAPVSGGILAGRADGIHIAGAAGDIIIESNRIESIGDDAINVRGSDFSVSAAKLVTGGFQVTADFEGGGFAYPGDQVAILRANFVPIAFAKVISSVGTTVKLSFPEGCTGSCQTSLVTAINYKTATDRASMFNLNRTSSRFSIRNNTILKNGGRAILVQTANGEVVGNRIDGVPANGILAMIDNDVFSEGPGPINLHIHRNWITRSNHSRHAKNEARNAAIALTVNDPIGGSYPFLQKILVTENCVFRPGFGAVTAHRTKSVEVLGNRYARINQVPMTSNYTPAAAFYSLGSTGFIAAGNLVDETESCN